MHLVYRFDTGGLENGVVNLINHMPSSAYRHMVVALTEVTDFRLRLRDESVPCVALHKPAGQGARAYPHLWRLLEMQPVAWAAQVAGRIHGEHGRDIGDLDGLNPKYQRIRRL